MRRLLLPFALLLLACSPGGMDYEQAMVDFVRAIADSSRVHDPGFGIFPQNGAALGTHAEYLAAVTGIGQEDIYYGYDGDGLPTPASVTAGLETDLDRFRAAGKLVLTIDYPFLTSSGNPVFDSAARTRVDASYQRARARGYVPYCTVRDLDFLVVNPGHEPVANVPPVAAWGEVGEFAYQLQHADGTSRVAFLQSLAASNYDLIVMDYSFDGSDAQAFTRAEIDALKQALGGKVLAYLSIGEAEDYRWYWQESWDRNHDGRPDPGAPGWLDKANPDWPGNYKVHYWEPAWQAIVFQYLAKVRDAGFDGVYLDIIDAYEYY